ncbi:nucleoid-associated protein [Pseudochrobactrum asaccharolyticum]|uniref:nucleoid-associated protein n=1 Tax=Pseudochrobactrum asaccharolyticum TaxID=354351 RepID=UPI004041B55B
MADSLIKNIAIHNLTRIGDDYNISLGSNNIIVTPTVQRIVDELHKLYARRPSKSYGKFEENETDYPTVGRVRNYVEVDGDFQALSSGMMETLRLRAKEKSASTGGHVFFTHFERDNNQFLLIALVTDKLGAALTGAGDITDVTHLDIDGFRFAGRINMTGWSKGESRYIGFLKGKGNVAEYFKEFLACNNAIQARVETTSLVNALKKFTDIQEHTSAEREVFLENAMALCERDSKIQKPIDFSSLANELCPDDPEPLSAFLADPELQLSDGFVADRRALRGFVSLKKKTMNWAVEFDRKSIHNGRVKYDPVERSLTLYDVPSDFHEELKEEIPDGG